MPMARPFAGGTERRPHDARLGDWRVEHPVREALVQAGRRLKHAAHLAHVLAHDDHARIALHLLLHALDHGLEKGLFACLHFGHGAVPAVRRSG
jgi:hypothetical protein